MAADMGIPIPQNSISTRSRNLARAAASGAAFASVGFSRFERIYALT
jgi:hypothetical protein